MSGNVIHLKLEYSEAINNRKEVLSAEINILQLIKKIKRYHELRTQELKKKIEIQKKLKEITININKLNKLLPVLKIPKILKRMEETTEEKETTIRQVRKPTGHPLETELQKIKRELESLADKA